MTRPTITNNANAEGPLEATLRQRSLCGREILDDESCVLEFCRSHMPNLCPLPPPASSPTPSPVLLQPSEDDWWLPDWVQPVSNSGAYGVDNAPPGVQDVEGVVLPWRLLEPQEGVYDWSLLTKALARKQPVWLRLFASDVSHCPAWLQKKYPDLKRHPFRWPTGGYDGISGYIIGQTTIRSPN
ncbi:MAG: beta-galactosidase [Dehalococcoidia bacterium]